MDRRHARSGEREELELGDPQWGEKFMAMIQRQMAQAENS
jgi:hypothetical protein